MLCLLTGPNGGPGNWLVLGCGFWLAGLAIVPNGITILTDSQGRTSGDGYVQFAAPDLVDRALEKHKEKIGHRWECMPR